MKILNLGAAGQISRILTDKLLKQTSHDILLFGRNVSRRLSAYKDNPRIEIIDGDFKEYDILTEAMEDVDIVYLNDMSSKESVANIVNAMEEQNIQRLIAATVLNIYGEVEGEFRKYTDRMVGAFIPPFTETARIIENSNINYTLMRLPWLYLDPSKTEVHLTVKGEKYEGTQISRHAVAQFVVEQIKYDNSEHYRQSYGVTEPETRWRRPSFIGFR